MAGRPSLYSTELADRICERIADGESLRTICSDDAMPSRYTVMCWLADRPEFLTKHARARELQAEVLSDEIMEIADDGRNDYMLRFKDDGAAYVPDTEHIQRSKLRVETRRWLMERMAPKKYGTKVTNEHTGPDGGPISTIQRTIVDTGQVLSK